MASLWTNINTIGKGTFFKYGLLETLIIMLFFIVCAIIIKRLLSKFIRHHIKVNTVFALRMVKITINTLAIYACLSLLTPFESILGKIWGSAGIIAVVLGFAAQEAMGNFVNGLLISTFKPFKIGDLVKVNNGEFEGFVVDISLRDTVIQTYENTKIIVPNSVMNKAVLENVSSAHNIKGNFLEMNISYESDLDTAMSIISEEVLKHPNYLDIRTDEDKEHEVPAVVTRLTKFNDSSMTLRTTVYSKNNAEGFAMLSDLRIAIKKRFDTAGIELPYPHCTVTQKNVQKQSVDSQD